MILDGGGKDHEIDYDVKKEIPWEYVFIPFHGSWGFELLCELAFNTTCDNFIVGL